MPARKRGKKLSVKEGAFQGLTVNTNEVIQFMKENKVFTKLFMVNTAPKRTQSCLVVKPVEKETIVFAVLMDDREDDSWIVFDFSKRLNGEDPMETLIKQGLKNITEDILPQLVICKHGCLHTPCDDFDRAVKEIYGEVQIEGVGEPEPPSVNRREMGEIDDEQPGS